MALGPRIYSQHHTQQLLCPPLPRVTDRQVPKNVNILPAWQGQTETCAQIILSALGGPWSMTLRSSTLFSGVEKVPRCELLCDDRPKPAS